MREISADYIWSMRELVERETAATCLFLQGACGNINTTELRHSFEPARHLGTILGCGVVAAFETAKPAPCDKLAMVSEKIELPPMAFSSVEEGEGNVAYLQGEYDRMSREAGTDSSGALFWTNLRLSRAKAKLDAITGGKPLPSVPAQLSALRLGDVAITTCPGEIFNEIGVEVKERSPLAHTCYVGYTNGMIDYVPMPSAYPEGGYEVTHLCKVGPGAAPALVKAALNLLGRLA